MKFKLVLCLTIVLLLSLSVTAIEMTKYIPSSTCGITQFEVLNQADYNYLIYNGCQEWRMPRILTNIKTTFVDNGLNAKVIPLDIAEMNQNGTPEDYSDDYSTKTIMINSVDVVPDWNESTKQLSWNFYFDTADANIILYYTIEKNAGKWGLEIYGWTFAEETNYIRLKNQIFSGGEFVEFDCSNINTTRECSFLDSENNPFSELYFDYPVNDGETYYDGEIWYTQQGQNHNLYQDLGRGQEIILDPTITSDLAGSYGYFVNEYNRPQCVLLDSNMLCVGKYDDKVLRLVTATLPELDDWTLTDWNIMPRPDLYVLQPIMTLNDNNLHISYVWATISGDRNLLVSTATSDYFTSGSWDTVWMGSAGNKKQNIALDVNSDGWLVAGWTVEGSKTNYMSWCDDCTAQENVSNTSWFDFPNTTGTATFGGLFIDDDTYIMFSYAGCSIGTYNRQTTIANSGSFTSGTSHCLTGALKIADDRLYSTYTITDTGVSYITYVDKDKNVADISLWSTPIELTINYGKSFSFAFVNNPSSDDFNSLIISYSESNLAGRDYNRFAGYRKFDTVTNLFTSDFIVIDENVESYSESSSTYAHYDYNNNNVYLLYEDDNSSNYLPSVYLHILDLTSTSAPDVNVIYPSIADLQIVGTVNIDFNVMDADHNSSNSYIDANIYVRNLDNGDLNIVVTDLNLMVAGVCGDTNFQEIQACSYSYDFSTNLNADTNYLIDINVTDIDNLSASDSSDNNFTILKVSVDLNVFSEINLLDLDSDGIQYGVEAEGWLQSASKDKDLNAVNVDRNQLLMIRALNDNSALDIYVNYVLVDTIDANAADPKVWNWYLFQVDSTLLTSNPQLITIDAKSSQDTTYIDYLGFMDTQDVNIMAGGDAVGLIWDVNTYDQPADYHRFYLDQDGVVTYIDANIIIDPVVSSAYGSYFAMFKTTESLDKNIIGWAQTSVSGSPAVDDTNKEMILDSTNPTINVLSMELDVQQDMAFPFDANVTDKYFSYAKLEIEGTPFDLTSSYFSANDWNVYNDFSFAGTGAYSVVLKVYDSVGHRTDYPFTVNSSEVTLTLNSDIQDTNWTRAGAIAITDASATHDSNFYITVDFTYTGTANIDYNVYGITVDNGDASSVNEAFWSAEDTNTQLSLTDLPQLNVSSYDLNGTGSHTERIDYGVVGNVATEWDNSGVADKRLIHVTSTDHNTALTDFWIKVPIRTPYSATTTHITLKKCVSGINWAGQTCGEWESISIYAQEDDTYNGGVYPTEDTDSDNLKDMVYFKVPNLSEHMYELDNTAGKEVVWTESDDGAGSGGGGGGGGDDKDEGIVEEITSAILTAPWFEPIGRFFGLLSTFSIGIFNDLLSMLGLNVARFGYIEWTPETIFYLISIVIIISMIFLVIPKAEQRARTKQFMV